MSDRAVVIEYSPRADDMADRVESKANELEPEGWKPAAFSVTGMAKAVLVFHK